MNKKLNKYDTILFDVDNTLLDFFKSERCAFEKTIEQFGIVNSEEIYNDYHLFNDLCWKQYEKNQIQNKEIFIKRFDLLKEKYGFSFDSNAFNSNYLINLSTFAFDFEDTLPILDELKGKVRLIIVTNGRRSVQIPRLHASKIDLYFEQSFLSEDIGFAKPTREYFDYVFSHIDNFDLDSTIIVGDSLTADISANKVGLKTVWLNRDGIKNDTDIIPDYEISNLYELKKIVL